MAVETENKQMKDLLEKGLQELGFPCSKEQINAFMVFLSELKKWNRAYSLTALKTNEDIIIKHFLDSILYLKAISPSPIRGEGWGEGLKVADAGTGAGFPGIPIKIIKPELDITLIESSRKKSIFLRHIIRILKLNGISVLNNRIESLGKRYEKTYDVIVSRATFKIRDFLKKACPYIKEDGWLVVSKGPKVSEETNFLDEVHRQGVMKKVITLPFIKAKRTLLMFQCQK